MTIIVQRTITGIWTRDLSNSTWTCMQKFHQHFRPLKQIVSTQMSQTQPYYNSQYQIMEQRKHYNGSMLHLIDLSLSILRLKRNEDISSTCTKIMPNQLLSFYLMDDTAYNKNGTKTLAFYVLWIRRVRISNFMGTMTCKTANLWALFRGTW